MNFQLKVRITPCLTVGNWLSLVATVSLLTTLSPVSAADPTCVTAPSGLVNWWAAEGNTLDSVGEHDGTAEGVSFGPGRVGSAFSFDGVDDRIFIDADPIDPPWTAEFWVNRQDADPQEGSAVLLSDGATSLKLEQWNNTRKVGFTRWWRDASSVNTGDFTFDYTAPVGQWVHLVFVGTQTNTQLYVNGSLVDTIAETVALPRATMGKDIPGGYNKPLNGLLDEVSLYNRVLLPAEILALYQADAAGKCVVSCVNAPDGLVNWWPGEGDATDRTGNNPGTANGVSYVPGQVGSAFSFDGIDDNVFINGTPIPPPWTGEFWVKREEGLEDSAVLLSDWNSALKLEQWQNLRKVGFTRWWREASSVNVGDFTFDYIAPVGEWVHLVFVGTTTDTQLYVNGSLQDSIAETMDLPRGQLGRDVDGGYHKAMHGLLDEPSLYNRALEPSEIQELYAAGSLGKSCVDQANDNFADALPITEVPAIVEGTTEGATLETGEQALAPDGFGGRTVWYSYTAQEQGLLRVVLPDAFSIVGQFSALIGQGTSASALTQVSNPVFVDHFVEGQELRLYADVIPGGTYHIVVDGGFDVDPQNGDPIAIRGGSFELEVDFIPSPGNDNFEQRTPILARNLETSAGFLAASRQASEPGAFGDDKGSLWWSWTAPHDGKVRLRATQAGNSLPALAAYQGDTLNALSPVDSTESMVGHTSQLVFNAVQGETYSFAITGTKYSSSSMFDRISDDLYSSGWFEFNFGPLSIEISEISSSVNDGTMELDFSATAQVEHLGTVPTAPLRFRLIARPGISKTEDLSGPNELPEGETALGIFPLPAPGRANPGLSSPVALSGICPAPTQTMLSGIGWVVFCLLEEQHGQNWLLQDKLLLLQGVWPSVSGFGGPGAGVIRLDAATAGIPYDELLSVEILGPDMGYEGQVQQYAGLATFIASSQYEFNETVWETTQFEMTDQGVFKPGNVTADTAVSVTVSYSYAGLPYDANRWITVIDLPPPQLTDVEASPDSANFSFSITGVLGREHVIEGTPDLIPNPTWIPIATQVISAPLEAPLGQLTFVHPINTNYFYRVRETQ